MFCWAVWILQGFHDSLRRSCLNGGIEHVGGTLLATGTWATGKLVAATAVVRDSTGTWATGRLVAATAVVRDCSTFEL